MAAPSKGDMVVCALAGDFGKPRPALVIQNPDAVVAGVLDSLLVCPLTSDLGGERMYRVAMRPTAANGLHTPSEVMAEKVTAVTPGRVRQVIGRADDVTIAAVERALLFMFGIGVH